VDAAGDRAWEGSTMRMLLKVTVPVEAGNKGIHDGTLPKVIQATMERIKPEAAYFSATAGKRCAYFFFDMKDASDMPAIAEPLFMGLNAEVEMSPAMSAEDLQAGLRKL
jgi:hypothetical protein